MGRVWFLLSCVYPSQGFLLPPCFSKLRHKACAEWEWNPGLEPDFRGHAIGFVHACVCVPQVAFIMLKCVHSSTSSFRTFVMKGWWHFKSPFLHQLRWPCDFCSHIYWSACIELSLNNLVVLCGLFNIFLRSVCKYFVENFCAYVQWGNLP